MILIFIFKEFVFDSIVLAPSGDGFFIYAWLDGLLGLLGLEGLPPFRLTLVNIDLAAQFFTHVKVSFFLALILAAPYIFYLVWSFVAPALYPKEKRDVRRSFWLSGGLFYAGLLFGYALIFPLTIRFLGTYQVSADVQNTISLQSYISMFLGLIFVMGVVFELPSLAALLSRFGIIDRKMLRKARKYAIVVSAVLAAVITPSGDAFTMCVVALPIYLLYELSIRFCREERRPIGDFLQ